jgi:hypothetical protein
MILMIIAFGLLTTLVGVALGGTVLELTLRAMGYSLGERPAKRFLRRAAGSPWQTQA